MYNQLVTLPLNKVTRKKTNKIRFYLILCCFSMLFFSTPSFSVDREEMKAVYLGVVSKHVIWLTNTAIQQQESSFFNICIFGDDSFGGYLKLYDNKKIKNKPVKILHPKEIENLADCQLVFIGQSKRGSLAKIFNFIDGKAILTVSLIRGFAEKKGMIQFYENGSRLDVKINYQVTLNHGFEIKSSLLKYSKVINR